MAHEQKTHISTCDGGTGCNDLPLVPPSGACTQNPVLFQEAGLSVSTIQSVQPVITLCCLNNQMRTRFVSSESAGSASHPATSPSQRKRANQGTS